MNAWETTLGASFKKRWKRYRRALKRCRRKVTEKNVHASRIETRRLLSVIELLNAVSGSSRLRKIRHLLKRHLNAFDLLRDTQVQRLLLDQNRRQFPETKGLGRMLAKRDRRLRKRATPRLRKIAKEVGVHSRPVSALAEEAADLPLQRARLLPAVDAAFARVVQCQQAMDAKAAETIHRTRVAFKKFRYMVEALQPLLAAITTERLAAMRDYQAMMGEVRDTEMFLTRIDKFARRDKGFGTDLGRFREWLVQRHILQVSHFLKHARRLQEFWPCDPA